MNSQQDNQLGHPLRASHCPGGATNGSIAIGLVEAKFCFNRSDGTEARVIAIIDAHLLNLQCLEFVFRKTYPDAEIRLFATVECCLDAEGMRPDAVIFCDHGGQDMQTSALSEVAALHSLFPDAVIIVLSEADSWREPCYLDRVLANGARCVIPTQVTGVDSALKQIAPLMIAAGVAIAPASV